MFTQLLQKESFKKIFAPEILLLLLFLLHLFFSWPGVMNPDSLGQYHQAMNGVYGDHHPALMAFVWRRLAHIYEGPGLMLFLNLMLLYGGVYFLMRSVDNKKIKYLMLLIPLIPPILISSFRVIKDVTYAFSFLFVNSYLAYITIRQKQLSFLALLLLLPVLIYGTAVKYQAQYVVILTLFWLAYAISSYKINYLTALKFLVLSGLFYYCLISINNYLVPHSKKSESWQFVKMYDITAISIDIDKPLLPDFIKTSNYSEKELRARFNHQKVDQLVKKDAILKKTYDKKQQVKLLMIWKKAVISHPFYYLKHRLINFGYIVLGRTEYHNVWNFAQKIGIYDNKTGRAVVEIIGHIFLPYLLSVMFALLYFCLSLYCLFKPANEISKRYAIVLFFFNSSAVAMALLIFFLSMAGIPRYIYITVCMANASHFFAYLCFKGLKQS